MTAAKTSSLDSPPMPVFIEKPDRGWIFNVADNSQLTSRSVKRPIICEYSGLKGVVPANGPGPEPTTFLREHQDQ
ncbi:uncharacterized protein BDW43DRAFT_274465 [Aspergillus alliaceus]|uniref:uncharacterized protein n=1 Tax=Petromyces alliaceus TaxID=209559 RepID=UPI0012A66181|nr:uncharacterized protein BDW43DRAFT_274465 [Aspergillus alliaceus]KAB8234161.1 hypothetical protein BDW43DRAFT_274465 [Aspergillus alliaceus]